MATMVSMNIYEYLDTIYPGLNICYCILVEATVSEYGNDVQINKVVPTSAGFETDIAGVSLPVFPDSSMNYEEQKFLGLIREKARQEFIRSQKNEEK